MKLQTLNGLWQYRIGKGEFSTITVPFSKHPVGHFECKNVFDLKQKTDNIFIKFYGITYYAKVYLNSGYYTISEVVKKCGFDDVSYFVRFFKKQLGLTSGAYKRQMF